MSQLIAICGVDGVGKTTVAQELACRLGYKYVKTPPSSYQDIRNFYETLEVSPFSRFCFYLGAVHESSGEIRATLSNGVGVVADRYIMSLMAYHEVMLRTDLGRYIEMADFAAPSANILLTAHVDKIRARILGRAKGFDSNRESDIDFLEEVQERFKVRIPLKHTVDTSDLSIRDVVDQCMDIVRGLTSQSVIQNAHGSRGVA